MTANLVDLTTRISPFLTRVEPNKLRGLAVQILKRRIQSSEALKRCVRSMLNPDIKEGLCSAWADFISVTGEEMSTIILSAALMSVDQQIVTAALVATRPPPHTLIRETTKAYREVIEQAQKHLIFACYVIYPPKRGQDNELAVVIDALVSAHKRGVKIELLYEQSVANNQKILKWLRKQLPQAEFYESRLLGNMHAKFACADERIAFVTSANITQPALAKNMEVGVLAHGGDIPKKLVELFRLMKQAQKIVPA